MSFLKNSKKKLLTLLVVGALGWSSQIMAADNTTQSLPEVRAEFSIFSLVLDQEKAAADQDNPLGGTNVAYRKEQLKSVTEHLQDLQYNPVTGRYPGLGEAVAADLTDLQSNAAKQDQTATAPIHHAKDFITAFIKKRCHKNFEKEDKASLDEILNTVQRGNYPALFCVRHHFGYNNCAIRTKDKCSFMGQHKENKGDFVMFLDRS